MRIFKKFLSDIKSFVSREASQEPDHANGAGEHLQCSARKDGEEAFDVLPEAGADRGVRDSRDRTASLAAESGSFGRSSSETVPKSIGASCVHHANARMYVAMQHAIQNGYANVVDRLLREGHSPDALDRYGNTALMLAAQKGSAEICSILLEAGADRTLRDARGRTALMIAEELHHTNVVRILNPVSKTLDCGLSGAQDNKKPVQKDTEPSHALHANACMNRLMQLAIEKKQTYVVTALLSKGEKTDALDEHGNSALMLAAKNGTVEICSILLEAGADRELRDSKGRTALMIAEELGHTEVAKILNPLSEGLNDGSTGTSEEDSFGMVLPENSEEDSGDVSPNASGTQQSDIACKNPVQEEIDRSNVRDIHSGMCMAMQFAIQKGHAHVVEILLSKGQSPDALDEHGNSALMLAAWEGSAEICSILLEAGADRDLRDSKGRTALMIAEELGHTEVAKILNPLSECFNDGSAGASEEVLCRALPSEPVQKDIVTSSVHHARVPMMDVAMQHAVQNGYVNAVEHLLREGQSPDALDRYGDTALMLAARTGSAKICSILLEAGADRNLRDRRGRTALMIAEKLGHAEVARILNSFSETRDDGSIEAPEDDSFRRLPSEGAEEDSGDVLPNASDMQEGDKASEKPVQKEVRAAGDRHVNEKMPPLMKFAIEKGNQPVVEMLLKRGESPDALDRYGNSPLMLAARNGLAEICALLLEAGADRELRDSQGRTALTIAEQLGHTEVARILKSISEDSESEMPGADNSFWVGDWEEKQPQAMPQEQDATVIRNAQQLVSNIAEFDPKDDGEKWDIESIDPWDEWNVPDDPFRGTSAGAAEEVSGDLLQKASDMQKIDRGREEPVQEEIRTSNVRHVHASMCMAMQFAIQKRHTHVVEILLSEGQSPDALDEYGNTALMLAAKEGAAEICAILLGAGANRDLRDARGRTARMIAEEFKHSDVIRIMDYFSYSYDNDGLGRARGG